MAIIKKNITNGNDTLTSSDAVSGTLAGLLGNDTYILVAGDESINIVEQKNGGIDTVKVSFNNVKKTNNGITYDTYALGDNVENLVLQGNGSINGTGNDLNNIITGNGSDNILVGGVGNDTLYGGGGADQLYGGEGNDLLVGLDGQSSVSGAFVLYDSTSGDTPTKLVNAIIGDDSKNIISVVSTGTGAPKLTGADKAVSFFDKVNFGTAVLNNKNTNFKLGSGILLTSGSGQPKLANTSSGFSVSNGVAGDTDLDTTLKAAGFTSASHDASVLEFSITVSDTSKNGISFSLMFGSEEFPEYVNSFVDIAGVYVDGVNYAYFLNDQKKIDTTKPLSVLARNLDGKSFFDNTKNSLAIEYDGMSAPLTISAPFDPSKTVHTIKIAVADTGDSALDSGLFISNLRAVNVAGGGGISDGGTVSTIDDILDGGTGADTMKGGAGNDIYYVDNIGDVVVENTDEGTDLVYTQVTYALSANVENLTLTGTNNINGYGNNSDNIILGNDGSNSISTGAGDDTLEGGLGDDTLNGGSGTDTASYEHATAGITVSLAIKAAQNTGVTGKDILVGIENLLGSGFADKLTGDANANTLSGGDGNDTLDGGAGNDTVIGGVGNDSLLGGAGDDWMQGGAGTNTLAGGTGNDTYIMTSATDVVVEQANEGTDEVRVAFSYTLGNNFESLVLTGTDSINATGNTLNNVLTSNAGNNILDGGSGLDTASYANASAAVTVSLVTSSAQDTKGDGTDTLINIEALLGSSFNDTLTGNSGANTITGGAGSDTVQGGLGNDTYIVARGSGADTLIENDSTTNTDVLLIDDTSVAINQLWFAHTGNDLVVSIIGTSDSTTIKDWYSGSANHVEQFQAAGKTLLDSQVETLVAAMAKFTPPAVGQTTLSSDYQKALNPIITASWK